MSFQVRSSRAGNYFQDQLNKEERDELLKLQTLRDLPKSKFATQACITGVPSRRGRKIVYSHIEVCKMVETIATQMREAGVRPQTPCAFILDNYVEAVIFFLALQWIGAIAVPIDPTLSADDIASFLVEVGTSIVVSSFLDEDERDDNELFQKVKEVCSSRNYLQWYITRSTNRGVYLEMEGRRAGEGAAWAGGAGDFKYDPTETCFRMAHGEAGHCLAVEMSHQAATEAVRDFSKTYNLSASKVTLLVSPFYSINGLMTVLATLYSGGNVVISEGSTASVETILKHAQEERIKWFSAGKDTLLEIYEAAKQNPTAVGKLELDFIRSVGGNLDEETLEDIHSVLGGRVLEAYGTPETCGLVSANKLQDNRAGTCGKAIGTCEISIFDNDSDEKVSAETVGRIGIHGRHVSERYLNNDYANKTCYISVSEAGEDKVFFITGDIGSLSRDGFLTVMSHGEAKKRAAALFRQEEHEIQSQRQLASMRALDIERERMEREEDEKRKRQEEEENEKRRTEEEALRLEEEERTKEEERLKKEAETTESSETSPETSSEEDKDEFYSDEEVPDQVSVHGTRAIVAPVPVPQTNAVELDDAVVQQIMSRLDGIERNQRRLEEELEGKHRMEIARMRELIEQYQEAIGKQTAPAPAVNMDEINTAINKAAASAESSSRDTAAAAQAAKDAAAAAAAAAAAHKANESNMVEVQDPDAVQKTVMVSLEEVEQAIRLHPAIESARAFGRPDPRYGVEVYCAVKPKRGARLSEPWLKLHAQSLLPAAFVPKKFFYKEGLRNEDDRAGLSTDESLKRISELSGYSSTKTIKGPAWSPQQLVS